jgi:hypothetical protein
VNAYTAAVDLPEKWLDWAIRQSTDVALRLGRRVILIGVMWDGQLALCTCGCAMGTPGSAVLIPDLLVLEGLANGYNTSSSVFTRDDGRSVLIFKTASR